VLATNVAETSLTVPGIRYVIDTGLARVKRYSYRNKVEQLQIEKVSQAAARQRAGRCGRVAAGVSGSTTSRFQRPAPFTDPEILRSSLAGVILRMKSLRLTDVESFPFIEPPPAKAIADGYALLQELGALDDDNALTPIGEALAKLPLDPRIGRMLVAARDLGCLKEVWSSPPACRRRTRASGRRTAAGGRRKAQAVRRREVGIPQLVEAVELVPERRRTQEIEQAADRQLPRPFPLLPAPARVARGAWPVACDGHRAGLEGKRTARHLRRHPQALLAGLLGNLGCKADESGFYLGARGIRYLIHPRRRCKRRPASGSWRPRSPRRRACSAAASPASNRTGWRKWALT
jgi:ATP-dependent helicase HrpA